MYNLIINMHVYIQYTANDERRCYDDKCMTYTDVTDLFVFRDLSLRDCSRFKAETEHSTNSVDAVK